MIPILSLSLLLSLIALQKLFSKEVKYVKLLGGCTMAKLGFIVFGVHKDGLLDPSGDLFIDNKIIEDSAKALTDRGVELVRHDVIVATKQEAKEALWKLKCDESVDGLILFSGTWVWAAHLIAAVRDYAATGRPVLIWTHPGSQGWRPVGGFVMHGALLEVGIDHTFVYGASDDAAQLGKVIAFARAAELKNMLNMSTIGTFGGRGMGQTCGAADPSQWMRMFGVDIDSRDTTELLETARSITDAELEEGKARLLKSFAKLPEMNDGAKKSISLYLALKKMIAKYGFDFYTIQSFPGLGDDYSATCFAQSLMLDDGVPTSTLSDFNTAMTVFLLMKLSGLPVYYGDLQHVDRATKEIKIIGDGAVPPSFADPRYPADYSTHGIATEGGAGGMSVNLTCRPGKGVLARIGRYNGEMVMTIAECEVKVPDNLEERKRECGIPFWPHAFAYVNCDIDALLENYMNEYGVLAYGENLLPALEAFCRMCGIRPIVL
jgi:L-fucose isomerase-like protein